MINGPFIIRNLKENDFSKKSYYKLLSQLSTIDMNEMSMEQSIEFLKNLNENHQIFVIEDETSKEIIATGTLIIENKLIRNYGKVGHIEDVCVINAFRNKGVGKRLIDHLVSISYKSGCYKIILNCDHNIVDFYVKCGFKEKGNQMAKYIN